MIYLHYLRQNTAKLRENKRKLAIKIVHAADFRRLFKSPAQESAPGNDGESKEAGISRILHPRHGSSIRSSFKHRGIIIHNLLPPF